MQFTRTNISKTYRNGSVSVSNTTIANISSGASVSGNFLPAISNGDGSYTVDISKVVFTGNLIGEGEITAYGQGSTGGGSTSEGSVTIYDGLDSVAVDAALSANQGRILREMILEAGGSTLLSGLEDITLTNLADGQILKYDAASKKWINGDGTKVTWTDIENKPSTFTPSEHTHNYASSVKVGNIAYDVASNVINLPAYPTLSSLGAVSSTDFNTHTSNTTLHITSTERTNWNDANSKKHSHSNKSVLDSITSAKVTGWDGVVTNWNKAFYFDSNGDLKAKVNVIGEKEVSAYGAGSSGGSFTIVDALTSTATDAALSANQGRILKELIDNVGGGISSWNDLTDKPSWITDTKPSYSWSEINDKPLTFTPSTHTHNYASTVKVGTTSYNVSGNTISLPAYPSALKNPYALTITLPDGSTTTSYDGSAAKSLTLTRLYKTAEITANISNDTGTLTPKAMNDWTKGQYVTTLGKGTDPTTKLPALTWTKNGETNYTVVPTPRISSCAVHQGVGVTYNVSQAFVVDSTAAGGVWGMPSDSQDAQYKNGQCLRMHHSATYYTDLLTGPNAMGNTHGLYFRQIVNGAVAAGSFTGGWRLLLDSYNYTRFIKSAERRYAGAGTSSAAGWYRIGKTNGWDSYGVAFIICISRTYQNTNNESYTFAVNISFQGHCTIKQISGICNVVQLDQIRVTGNSNSGDYYFDIHVNSASTNQYSWIAFGQFQSSTQWEANPSTFTNTNTMSTTTGERLVAFKHQESMYSELVVPSLSTGSSVVHRFGVNGSNYNRGYMSFYYAGSGSTSNRISFGLVGQESILQICGNGYVGIGIGNPSEKLHVNGNIIATGEITAYSDVRLKTNIQQLENRGYITPVTYKKDGKSSIGFIAQELRKKYPELVTEDNTEDKYLSVNYAQYVAVLQAQIIELNNRIKNLEECHQKVQE